MNITPAYIPILRAKTGELEALSQLKGKTPQEIIPFFEIPKITSDIQNKVAFRNSNQITIDYIDDLTIKIKQLKWSRIFFDFFDWKMDSYTENGEHVINYMFRKFINNNIKVNPVIGFDRWDSIDYKKAILSIDLPSDCSYCIRIDSESINDSYDRDFFRERLLKIFSDLGVSSRECILHIDFSDLTKRSIEDVYKDMNRLLDVISEWDFSYLILSGGSFPAVINDAVKDIDSTDEVARKEMVIWKMIQHDEIKEKVVFSDYGIRNPLAAEGIRATHANGKIRYTIKDKYFVARGHSKQKGNKGEQQYELARVILNSGYYLGPEFSWGDERIKDCSEEKMIGNPTQWISYDTNHHITYVVAEIKEFERSYVISRERSRSTV